MTSVRELLGEYLDGIRRRDLIALVREHINPDATDGQLGVELEQLGDEIIEEAGLIRLRRPAEDAGAAQLERGEGLEGPSGPRRLVAVDLETVLRYTTARPDGERTIFQVGAVRFGPDAAWAVAAAPFDRFVRLAPELAARIVKADLREQVETLGDELDDVLNDFLAYIDEADAIVAYNGRSFDFPLLDEVLVKHLGEGIPARIKRVDGLYLALAVWPVPPRRHALSRLINDERFDQIRARLEIDLTGVVAHDAVDDCRMLADLMRFAAAEIEAWPPDLATLVRSVGRSSDAWTMLFELAGPAPSPRAFSPAEVRATIAGSLAAAGKAPLRAAPATRPAGTVLDLSALGEGGRVDIDRLVRAIRGEGARPRESQRAMVEAMRGWLAGGLDALAEAPTGTGKSYAILAIALEWLAADPANRVVLSTFTRQLQRQLAADIYALHEAGAAPGLIGLTSLVKGSSNRLSLAGLVRALADATTPPARRRRGDFVGDHGFAELAIYLALRFVARAPRSRSGRRTRSTRSTSSPSSSATSRPVPTALPDAACFCAFSPKPRHATMRQARRRRRSTRPWSRRSSSATACS